MLYCSGNRKFGVSADWFLVFDRTVWSVVSLVLFADCRDKTRKPSKTAAITDPVSQRAAFASGSADRLAGLERRVWRAVAQYSFHDGAGCVLLGIPVGRPSYCPVCGVRPALQRCFRCVIFHGMRWGVMAFSFMHVYGGRLFFGGCLVPQKSDFRTAASGDPLVVCNGTKQSK